MYTTDDNGHVRCRIFAAGKFTRILNDLVYTKGASFTDRPVHEVFPAVIVRSYGL